MIFSPNHEIQTLFSFSLKKLPLAKKPFSQILGISLGNRHGSPALKTPPKTPDAGGDKGDKADKMIRALLGF